MQRRRSCYVAPGDGGRFNCFAIRSGRGDQKSYINRKSLLPLWLGSRLCALYVRLLTKTIFSFNTSIWMSNTTPIQALFSICFICYTPLFFLFASIVSIYRFQWLVKATKSCLSQHWKVARNMTSQRAFTLIIRWTQVNLDRPSIIFSALSSLHEHSPIKCGINLRYLLL